MRRFWTACVTLFLVPLATAGAEELKPKLGDIGGVFYTEVSEDRDACLQAIRNMIALCRENTSFVSNTLDRKYPGCLPIFRDQSQVCVDHFWSEAHKCQGSGSVRIEDFRGFACTVSATVLDEGGAPEQVFDVALADRVMQARTRTNVRSGPGTEHSRIGLLEAGERVHVTGESGEWLRIDAPDGGAAFVHGSLLVDSALQASDATAEISPKCEGKQEGAACWHELAEPQGCYFWYTNFTPIITWTWTGSCAKGIAEGRGELVLTWSGGSSEYSGTLDDGILQGHWILRLASGTVHEGSFVDGAMRGRWVERHPNGMCFVVHYGSTEPTTEC